MTYPALLALYTRINGLSERIVSSRFADLRITLCALAMGLVFTTFPNYPRLVYDKVYLEKHCSWDAVLLKRDNLFLDTGKLYSSFHHNANLTFRLVVPLVARIFGLGKIGIFAFQSACGVVLLWAVARIVHRITGDLVSSLFVACGVASTWAGTTSFSELRGVFDGVALLLLACAVLFEAPWLAGLFAFLTAWTDERGLIATSLVYLYHVYRRQQQGHDWRGSYLGPTPFAVIFAWAAYFATRFAMAWHFHITTNTTALGLKTAIRQANNFPIGTWTALEGGWLLVVAASLVLIRKRRIAFLVYLWGAIAIIVTVSMSCFDITRSMAYVLPALFIAIAILRESESGPDLRSLCALSTALSILWPNYYAQMNHDIFWNVPLPVRLAKWLTGAETNYNE
jgi:hypothetical protein